MSRIVSFVRKDSSKGIENLSGYTDDITIFQAKRLIDDWDRTFGPDSWRDYRSLLKEIADTYSAFPRVHDWKSVSAEWIAPVDDDDWHLDAAVMAVDMAGNMFDCVTWNVLIYDLTDTCSVVSDNTNYMRGPHTCGYAIRRSFLESLTDEQQFLILSDHFNAHRYTHFAGRKYMMTHFCGGVHIISPASITSAKRNAGKLSLSTADNYKILLPHAVVGVDHIILHTIDLVSAKR